MALTFREHFISFLCCGRCVPILGGTGLFYEDKNVRKEIQFISYTQGVKFKIVTFERETIKLICDMNALKLIILKLQLNHSR